MTSELAERGRRVVASKLEPNTQWERRNAVRLTASRAHDATDFMYLLGLLGLMAEDGRKSARGESL